MEVFVLIDLYEHEKRLLSAGYHYICGVDEAGRGPLAGPVVAAAVILKEGARIKGLNDSKKLSKKMREKLVDEIKENSEAIGVCFVSNEEIDTINILRATREAMISAVKNLKVTPDYVLIDALSLEDYLSQPTEGIIKGDMLSASIAAASVIAKVTRDNYMDMIHNYYPEYGFNKHKGYPTKQHIDAIKKYGITPIHRKTFKPIKDMLLENAI